MTDPAISVQWPAILKQGDDPELLYITDQQHWIDYRADPIWHCSDNDYLVDVSGAVYTLPAEKPALELRRQYPDLTLNDILGLVKAHAAQAGSCCVAKLYAPSIRDAFRLIDAMDETTV